MFYCFLGGLLGYFQILIAKPKITSNTSDDFNNDLKKNKENQVSNTYHLTTKSEECR